MNAITVKNENELVQYKNVEMSELLDRFIRYIEVSPLSARSYIYGIKAFFKYLSENGIKQPTRENVIEYKKHLLTTKANSTVALYLSSLRRFFSWCLNENLYADITMGIKSPRVDAGHKRDALSGVQLKKIINGMSRDSLKGLRDYAIFCLTAATGLRTVEVIRADICDIRNMGGEDVLFVCGKGRSSKTDFVKITGHVMNAIQTYLNARGAVSEDEPLFVSCSHRNAGRRMTTRSISRICKTAMIHAGFNSSRLTAHSLRHSAVTLALLAGMTLQEVSQFARHSNIAVTLIYSHDVSRLQSRCERAISDAIFD